MCREVLGSSPSKMIATWSPRLARWRSRQLAETLSSPSSNHLIETLAGVKLVFFTRVKGFVQSMRCACSRQKASGSTTDRLYISRYLAWAASAFLAKSAGTGWILSDIFFLPRAAYCSDFEVEITAPGAAMARG